MMNSFTTSSPQVWLYFSVTGANIGDTTQINWRRPNGVLDNTESTTVQYTNECFSYHIDINGASAASYPGTWTVQVFWDNSTTPLFSLNFTISNGSSTASPTLVTSLISNTNGIVNGSCVTPPSVSSFTTAAPQVWVYFYVTGAIVGSSFLVNWVRPDGTVYTTDTGTEGYTSECWSYFIPVSGATAASFPGTWTVQVFWNQSNTPLFSLPFTITNQNPSTTGNYFVPVVPCRLVDTRNTGSLGGPSIASGASRDFPIPSGSCRIPSAATAYSLNVTVVPQGPLGFLTIWPTGQPQPLASTLNSDGRIKANAAIVPAGSNGSVSVYATNTTDVILDINGYFVSGSVSGTLAFYPMTPCRIADTRNAVGVLGGPSLVGGNIRAFPILVSPCDVSTPAQAYSLNFTAVPDVSLGYLTAWPSGQPQPFVSSLNAPTGSITANAVIVPAGSSGMVDVFSTDNSDLVIDINGYFALPESGGLKLYTLQPCRVLDTRQPPEMPVSSLIVNVLSSSCKIPASAQAYVFNATVVPVGSLGFLTLWPNGQPQPLVSTLNASDGAITSNMAIVPTTDGSIDVFASQPTHLILDISGYFAPY
jgi:hypothetical protein